MDHDELTQLASDLYDNCLPYTEWAGVMSKVGAHHAYSLELVTFWESPERGPDRLELDDDARDIVVNMIEDLARKEGA